MSPSADLGSRRPLPTRARRLAGAVRLAVGLTAAAFLVVAFRRSLGRSEGLAWPSAWQLGAALLLCAVALGLAYQEWRLLAGALPAGGRQRLAWSFYLAQLAKYAPGGVWQVASQVGGSQDAGLPLPRAAVAYAGFVASQLAAAGTVGATLAVTAPWLDPVLRLAALGGLGLCLLLNRRWLGRLASWLRRAPAPELQPPPGAVAAAWRVGLLVTVASVGAFAVVLSGIRPDVPWPASAAAFALAWVVGFLAVPAPSGLGVREAVLLVLLGPVAGAHELIGAAVLHRLLTMTAEAGWFLAASASGWRLARRSDRR